MQERRTSLTLAERLANATVIGALVAGGLVVASIPAAAAPNFQLPFPCGDRWRLNTWDAGHAPALDMVSEPQSETEGAPLVAPADGRVNMSREHENAGEVIQIDHGGGHFTTYIHLQRRNVSAGDTVERGQSIGRVGHTGETSNGTPRLHYEQGYDANGDGYATWGFDGAERVTARFDGVAYGPASGGEWRNVESRNCGDSTDGGDFNADGVGDIFSAATGTLTIWNGRGSNNFASASAVGSGWTAFSRPIAGDFDGDGVSDLAAVKDGSTLHIWNGKGDNRFGSAVVVGSGWGEYDSTLMAVGDVNGDGRDDIGAVRAGTGTLYVWNGKGDNRFGSATEIGAGWTAFSRPTAGDFDGDGVGDLAAVKDGSALHIWNGKGDNRFGSPVAVGTGWGEYDSTLMTLGDVNGDGRTDIGAVREGTGTLYVWNGKGDNRFSSATAIGDGWAPYF